MSNYLYLMGHTTLHEYQVPQAIGRVLCHNRHTDRYDPTIIISRMQCNTKLFKLEIISFIKWNSDFEVFNEMKVSYVY